jgi:hypothetical protein
LAENVLNTRVNCGSWLKADAWFRRGLLLMLSPDSRANLARCQAEAPLIAPRRFPKPALLDNFARPALFNVIGII